MTTQSSTVEVTPTNVPLLLTRREMEIRRILGGSCLRNGMTQAHVARKFGVSRTTVNRWNRCLCENPNAGLDVLERRKPSGRPRRLTQEQEATLMKEFGGGNPTTARFAERIRELFGITYHPDHAGRIMCRLGIRRSRLHPIHEVVRAAAD